MQTFVEKLNDLDSKIINLKKKVAANAGINENSQDSRLVAFSGMSQAFLGCKFWLNSYINIADRNSTELAIVDYSGSSLPLKETSRLMMNQLRLGAALLFHFKLENLFDCLYLKLSKKKIPISVLDKFKEISKIIELENTDRLLEIIKAFLSIRNTLHNNGIHNRATFLLIVSGTKYLFENGKVAQCCSLPHIITLFNEILGILEAIFENKKIVEIKGFIPDAYGAWISEEVDMRSLDRFGLSSI